MNNLIAYLPIGEERVSMKGCFISDSCNSTECIASNPPRSNLKYCCCRGNMCNVKHKYVPIPPAPAELEGRLLTFQYNCSEPCE